MILLTHHIGEPHGILGAQIAATYLSRNLGIPTIVLGLKREFSKESLLKFIDDHYREKERIIGFSHMCGRKDIIELIGELKNAGFTTLLGGPQACQDYYGEEDAVHYPLRFKGLKNMVDIAFKGPVDYLHFEHLTAQDTCFELPWKRDIYLEVDWTNLYIFSDRAEALPIKEGQVLNAIGCQHAKGRSIVRLDPPSFLEDKTFFMDVVSYGCTFCDVARDKGFHGYIDKRAVLAQIKGLPEENGRKIPFELIDEYPIVSIRRLLDDVEANRISLSQVQLVCRVNDITAHADLLPEILSMAKQRDMTVMFASIGFESFSEKILKNFNKGITVRDIIKCVEILRRLKDKFGRHLLYKTAEGANHGFIHPTPWDDSETISEMNRNIAMNRLFEDILPQHSIPLIIHHGSYLADWLRHMESKTPIRFRREGTWIEWWSPINSPENGKEK